MLSFRPKGGISDSANDRDVSTSLRFARHDRTTFILSTYLYRDLPYRDLQLEATVGADQVRELFDAVEQHGNAL
jgi:hypothetical protein